MSDGHPEDSVLILGTVPKLAAHNLLSSPIKAVRMTDNLEFQALMQMPRLATITPQKPSICAALRHASSRPARVTGQNFGNTE